MILLVNGDSHSAGAEIMNPHAFAEDDPRYVHLGRQPHPDNLRESWGYLLSRKFDSSFVCLAESASSNTRIIRTTRKWLDFHELDEYVFIIVQWSTWEREEWFIDETFYQVNGSGVDMVPLSHQQKYKEYVSSIDWTEKTNEAHDDIWDFHQELTERGVRHLFFNGNNYFESINTIHQWGDTYIGPYDRELTYDHILRSQGCHPVNSESWHFGSDGHQKYANFLYKYILDTNLLQNG
jgi:hypothetical protein